MGTNLGVQATSPTTNVTKPATTLPPSQQNNKGVITDPVTGNSYAIGASGKYERVTPSSTATATPPSYPGLMGANIQSQTTGTSNTNTSPTQYSATNPPTYPGLVGDTANEASSLNTTAAQLGKQGQVTPEEQAAKNKLAALPGVQGAVTANIENHPSDFAFQMGREAVAGRNIEAMRQALADQATAYATTRQANTQAYTGEANAQNAAGGLLGTAAGLAQPQLGSIGQVPFLPLDQTQGQILGTQNPSDLQNAANILGQFQGYQAQAAAPLLGSAQGTQAQAAAPGVGAAAGTQAVAAAPGTTQAGQYGQIAAYKSAAQQGEQLAGQLSDLITKFGLNPSDINAVNAGFQKIAANTSDPHYQALSNYLNDVSSRYAQVLTPPGGSATDMTRSIAQSMINATAAGKSIQQVLAALDQQAQAVISAVPATGNVPGNNSQYQNGQTTSAGGYDFVFQNGKWVPK